MTVEQALRDAQVGATTAALRDSAERISVASDRYATLSDDLERAFPDLSDDERFVKQASGMRATLDGALSAPPINCEGVNAVAAKIGESCKGCHQDFR